MPQRLEIAIFPLQLIAFPQERVPLHLFEPRYRRMAQVCQAEGVPFGIIPVVNKQAVPTGTLMRLEEIAHTYPDGRLDVVTRGLQPFAVEEFIPKTEEDEAHRACIELLEIDTEGDYLRQQQLRGLYAKFHQLIKSGVELEATDADSPATALSYTIGHTAGLSDTEKLELLRLPAEDQRLELLISHLEAVIFRLEAVENTRFKAQQNGHFRIFPEVDFDFGKEGV